jgi:hypothetical protein
MSFASRAQDDGLRRVRPLDRSQFSGQQLVAANLVERDAAGFRLRRPTALKFPVTILGVLGQFLDNLRLASGSEVQVRQFLANLFCQSGIFDSCDSVDGVNERLPALTTLERQDFPSLRSQPVIAPPALTALLDPAALNPAVLLQAILQWI